MALQDKSRQSFSMLLITIVNADYSITNAFRQDLTFPILRIYAHGMRRGTTLIELIVVLLIMAILSGLLLSGIMAMKHHSALDLSVERTVSMLHLTRNLAISNNAIYMFKNDPTYFEIQCSDHTIKNDLLDGDCRFYENIWVEFLPDGSAQNVFIGLHDSKDAHMIQVLQGGLIKQIR